MKAIIKLADGKAFIAKSESNHWIPVDRKPPFGHGAASDPFQLFIISSIGCISMDVIDMLSKSKKPILSFELEADVERAETYPKIVRKIQYHARIDAPEILPEQVSRAFELSLTKYCSVTLSIDRSVEFKIQFTLNGVDSEVKKIERTIEIYN